MTDPSFVLRLFVDPSILRHPSPYSFIHFALYSAPHSLTPMR